VSRLTCELLADPELWRIAEQARDEVLAEATARVEAEKRRLLASRNRFDHRRAAALHPAITIEEVEDRIHELTEVRTRLRRAERELARLRAAGQPEGTEPS
jgi:hypothetical protein